MKDTKYVKTRNWLDVIWKMVWWAINHLATSENNKIYFYCNKYLFDTYTDRRTTAIKVHSGILWMIFVFVNLEQRTTLANMYLNANFECTLMSVIKTCKMWGNKCNIKVKLLWWVSCFWSCSDLVALNRKNRIPGSRFNPRVKCPFRGMLNHLHSVTHYFLLTTPLWPITIYGPWNSKLHDSGQKVLPSVW